MEHRQVNRYYNLYQLDYKRNTTRKHKQQQQRIGQDACNQQMRFNLVPKIIKSSKHIERLKFEVHRCYNNKHSEPFEK